MKNFLKAIALSPEITFSLLALALAALSFGITVNPYLEREADSILDPRQEIDLPR